MVKENGIPSGSLSPELKRGVIVLAILSQLEDEHYGYALRESLAEKGLEVREGTLYPLLRRLESQGLLVSDWRLGDRRPRRYYRISKKGRRVLESMLSEWNDLARAMKRLLASNKE